MNPELEPVQKPEEKVVNKVENKPIKALRTFAGDLEEALSKNKSSSATIMIAEQKRREERPELTPPPKLSIEIKNKTFFVTGSTLVILSIVVIGAVYYYINLEPVTAVNVDNKSLISSSKENSLLYISKLCFKSKNSEWCENKRRYGRFSKVYCKKNAK